jgi:FtsP/CotA-like multicopper oxidase with cupredoxin domain
MSMTRRDFLVNGATFASAVAGGLTLLDAQDTTAPETIQLRIAPLTLDVGPKHSVRTTAYNGHVPGPLFRWKEGQRVTVEVANETTEAELVHWHGLQIPSESDGGMEEGTPMVPPRGTQRYSFIVKPAGTRWYHSHVSGGRNFTRGTYTGQFGVVIVDASNEPGAYDMDVPILLHEWEPSLSEDDINYRIYSINGKMLGAGEPVRVRAGQKVLFRIVNASATATHRIALAGHSLTIVALDGNRVPTPRTVPVVELGPAERADCIVEMKNPGVWVFGETRDTQRTAGMGTVVEYADAQGPARWLGVPNHTWDYAEFGVVPAVTVPGIKLDGQFPLQFKSHGAHGWTINGKSWPHTDPLVVKAGRRYRLVFDNQSSMDHPVHLHRHTFELTKFVGKDTAGVFKDVIIVPGWKEVEVDFLADNPGLSLFHCHQQFHMDQGFMALLNYS